MELFGSKVFAFLVLTLKSLQYNIKSILAKQEQVVGLPCSFRLNCEAQARVRQGSARDGSQGKRPQSLNPSLELTLKLVATRHHPPEV